MLELKGLRKSYPGGVDAVAGVDVVIEDGEFFTILGPSGSGKSSILAMVAGFSQPTSGEMLLDGRSLASIPASKRGIGVVFQHYALFPHLTVAENVAYPLHRRRWPKARIAERVTEMLRLIGLPDHGGRRPSQLSGGQQQRVALARALAFEPALLLMDEPLGALDREIRAQMQEEIRRIHRRLRPTVLYVTHDKGEAFGLSDRVAIMRDGRMAAVDSPDRLYQEPSTAFVARFFGGHQVLPLDKVEECGTPGHLACHLLGERAEVRRPEDGWDGSGLALAVFEGAIALGLGPSHTIQLTGRVDDHVYLGPTVRVRCRIDGLPEAVDLTLPSGTAASLRPGDTFTGHLDPALTRLVSP